MIFDMFYNTYFEIYGYYFQLNKIHVLQKYHSILPYHFLVSRNHHIFLSPASDFQVFLSFLCHALLLVSNFVIFQTSKLLFQKTSVTLVGFPFHLKGVSKQVFLDQ